MERVTQGDTAAALNAVIEDSAKRIEAEASPCSACGGLFTRFLVLDGALLCRSCYGESGRRATVEEQAASVRAELPNYVVAWLVGSGLSDREAHASLQKMSREIVAAVERNPVAVEAARTLHAGEVPSRGFGLSGTAGIGKSFALAALLWSAAEGYITREVETRGFAALTSDPWLRWIAWPQTVTAIRTLSLEDNGHAQVAALVQRWKSAPVLVLDDLGPERMRGTYSEDWATEQLDTVVDQRSRDGLATFYTTNLDEQAIAKRYGARFFSRLCRENPLLVIGAGRDRRGGGGA